MPVTNIVAKSCKGIEHHRAAASSTIHVKAGQPRFEGAYKRASAIVAEAQTAQRPFIK